MRCAADLLGHPEHVPDIDRNRAAVRFAPGIVIDRRFVGTVEIHANQFSFGIQYRTPGVAAGRVHVVQNCDRDILQFRILVLSEVLCFVEIEDLLRRCVRIFACRFLDDARESSDWLVVRRIDGGISFDSAECEPESAVRIRNEAGLLVLLFHIDEQRRNL